MPTQKIDPKVIFASDAPAIDKPPVFSDKTKGWDVARANDGRPEIKQMNKMQQDTDLKILWLNENAVLPYDASIDYPDGAVTIKDGSFKQLSSGSWVDFLDDFADKDEVKRGIANRYDSSLTYNSGERVVLTNGDIVKSTIDGNTNDPNVGMMGWAYSSLTPSNNLSDVADKATARTNLGVYSKTETNSIAGTPNATETVEGKAKIATTAIAQAGVNDTDFITALKLANTRRSVWVNKTGMLFGTTYMNTALYEKEISFLSGIASGLVLTAKVTFKNLTTNIETIVYFGSASNWTGGIASSANFTVPPNTSFKIEIVRTDSLSTVVTLAVAQWSERYYV